MNAPSRLARSLGLLLVAALLVPAAAKEEITRQGLKYVYRLNAPADQYASSLIDAALTIAGTTFYFAGDQFVAETHPVTGKPGWWETLVSPGRVLDTDRFFVICANVIGGCRGTTGPGSINPATGCPWAMAFPAITIADMVRLQKKLVDHLGINHVAVGLGPVRRRACATGRPVAAAGRGRGHCGRRLMWRDVPVGRKRE